MNTKTISKLTMLAGLLAMSAQAEVNLVQNPDFATGDLTGWFTYGRASANQIYANNGSEFDVFPNGSYLYGNSTGYVSTSLKQYVTTTAGDTYTLSFSYEVYTGQFLASIGGVTLQTVNSATSGPTTSPLDFTGTGGSELLEFDFDNNPAIGLNDATIIDTTPSVVPEPANCAVFGGLGLLALSLRRRAVRRTA